MPLPLRLDGGITGHRGLERRDGGMNALQSNLEEMICSGHVVQICYLNWRYSVIVWLDESHQKKIAEAHQTTLACALWAALKQTRLHVREEKE
jgi:hypothetical protein